jgi:hypothetical protein
MRRFAAAMLMLLVSIHMADAQSLFDTGRDANAVEVSVTSNPNYFRGSMNFAPLVAPGATTIFNGGASAGDFCNFDLVATMQQAFEEVPDLLIELAPLIVLGIGIHFLCATFPEQCSLAKDIKNYANLLLRFQRANCYQVIESASYGGVAASDSALGECLRGAAPGESSQAVWSRCSADRSGFIPLPNGGAASEVDVIATILETAGLPAEDATRIQGYTGKFVIRGAGNIFETEKTAPSQPAIEYFQEQKETFVESVSTLVESTRGGAEPSPAELNALSVPGVPLPRAAIESIAGENDPNVRVYKADALAASLALAKSKWDLTEDLHTLAKAVQASEVTPDQEKVTREALANMAREIGRLEQLKAILDEHFKPAVEGLLEARANQLAESTIATASAQPVTAAASRFETGQNSFGYAQ